MNRRCSASLEQRTAVALALLIQAASPVWAQSEPVNSTKVNYIQKGNTVYVSGRLSAWAGRLMNAVPNPNDEAWMQRYLAAPERQVLHIVFVNAIGRPDDTRGTDLLNRRIPVLGLSMTVVGRCDIYCARIFVAGKERSFGVAPPGQETWMDIRPPINVETMKIETRWPLPQVEAFTRVLPELKPHEPLFVDAIRNTTDEFGGLKVFLDKPAEYCASLGSTCKAMPGTNAKSLGLVTAKAAVSIELPEELDVGSPETKWPPLFNPRQ